MTATAVLNCRRNRPTALAENIFHIALMRQRITSSPVKTSARHTEKAEKGLEREEEMPKETVKILKARYEEREIVSLTI